MGQHEEAQAVSDTESDEQQEAKESFDLEHSDRDQGRTEKEQKPARKQFASKSGAQAQERETSLAGEGEATLERLSLYDDTRMVGNGVIGRFADAFEIYRIPMGLTLGALGRVQDLLSAGAPQTPKEMSKVDQGTFRELKQTDADSHRMTAAKDWAKSTHELNASTDAYMAVLQQLEGAISEYRGAKEILHRRELQAEKRKKSEELEKLEAPAKMIAGLIEVAEMAYGMAGKLSKIESPAESFGEESAKTGMQKGAAVGKAAYETKEALSPMVAKAGVTTEGVINWLLGKSDEIAGLQRCIAQLNEDIAKADLKAEDLHIDASAKWMSGTSAAARGQAFVVGSNRIDARDYANIFASTMGGENVDAHLLTLCAEAYQELRMFGEKASGAQDTIEPLLAGINSVVHDHAYEIGWSERHQQNQQEAVENGTPTDEQMSTVYQNDFQDVMNAAKAVITYRDEILRPQLPQWRERADAWRAFFSHETGVDIDTHQAQIDAAKNGQ
jgi:hypothetical protein